MNQPFHLLNPPAERRATDYSVHAFAIASLISFAGCADILAYIAETPDEYQVTKYRFVNHINGTAVAVDAEYLEDFIAFLNKEPDVLWLEPDLRVDSIDAAVASIEAAGQIVPHYEPHHLAG